MISKMTKYDFVLYAGQSEDFIERLRELGLVDITTTGWEAQEDDRQLISDIESRLKAKDALDLHDRIAEDCRVALGHRPNG